MKKNDPSKIAGQIMITFTLILDDSSESVKEKPDHATQSEEQTAPLTLLKKGCAKPIVLKSPRLIQAFGWLQDKAGLTISVSDLAEHLGCNKDETRKVLQTLRTEKKLIHYSVTETGIKLVRVDDIDRLKPRNESNNGVSDEG